MRRFNLPHLSLTFELLLLTLLTIWFVTLWLSPPLDHQSNGLETSALNTILFDPTYRPVRLEYERLAGVLYPARIGLENYGHIPTWNPYLGSGEPFINNAFSYLFNPFHSLPVLLSESYVQGTKLAIFIALLIAGYNMWALALAVGVGALGRILAGTLYMASGGIAGKFYAGHFQLALSLAWPPLVIAAFWWTLRGRSRFAPIAFAVAFALLFFAGNIYYVLHTLLGCAFILIIHLIFPVPLRKDHNPAETEFATQNSELGTRNFLLRRAALAAALAFGLTAVQFFPVWLTRDYVIHDNQILRQDGTLEGSYSFTQAISNLTVPWPDWNIFTSTIGAAVSVDYAYIGSAVFILIGLALIFYLITRAHFSKSKSIKAATIDSSTRNLELGTQHFSRIIWSSLILAVFMMIWGTGQGAPLEFLYKRIALLAEFRFVGRALSIATLWWILMGAIAVDLLWKWVSRLFRPDTAFTRNTPGHLRRAVFAALLVWVYFLLYSLANTSTRSGMVLYNYGLLNAFDSRRFTSFHAALVALAAFILISVLLDTIFIASRKLFTRPFSARRFDWRIMGTRLLQIGVLAITFWAMVDSMLVNSRLYGMERLFADFSVFYPTIRASDPDPFPAVNEPYAPSAFSAYEAEIRNWGLDEGWRPGVTRGLIPYEAGTLPDLPRWAIASKAYGDISLALAEQFVTQNGYVQRECAFVYPYPDTDDPCNLLSDTTAILYEKPDALPYAFVVPADILTTSPGDLNAATVFPAEILEHRQDSMSIQAATPADGDFYLIVQEAHFPGWAVTVDGTPVKTVTADTYHDIPSNRGFIAVPMLAGEHTYSLRFEPPGFTLGIIISLLTVLVIVLYAMIGIRWRA